MPHDDFGICHNLSYAQSEYNYKNAIQQNQSFPGAIDNWDGVFALHHSWQFPANETTYCPEDDLVCRQCIEERFSTDQTNDNRFCVGANGCVCIRTCSTQVPQCGNGHNVSSNATQPSSELPSWDECRYLPFKSNECHTLRPCHDCLNKQGCRISADGTCGPDYPGREAMYDYRLAFRYNLSLPVTLETNLTGLSATQSWHFSARNVSYCAVDDPKCHECITNQYWLPAGQPADSRFCVGTNDCVCVANCVRPDMTYVYCPVPDTKQASIPLTTYLSIMVCGGILIILLSIGLDIHKRRKCMLERAQQALTQGQEGQMASEGFELFHHITTPTERIPSVSPELTHLRLVTSTITEPRRGSVLMRARPRGRLPQLGLMGWNAQQRQQMEAETRELSASEDIHSHHQERLYD